MEGDCRPWLPEIEKGLAGKQALDNVKKPLKFWSCANMGGLPSSLSGKELLLLHWKWMEG